VSIPRLPFLRLRLSAYDRRGDSWTRLTKVGDDGWLNHGKLKDMDSNADSAIGQIVRADDLFLTEVGRLTLLFSYIEDCLRHDVLRLQRLNSDLEEQGKDAASKIAQLRILDKRDRLKQECLGIGQFYRVDVSRVGKILDELGDINRIRRTVVHGSVRWSVADNGPVFVDSRGNSSPAWHKDIGDLNLRILQWVHEYHSELATLLRGAQSAIDGFAERLLQEARLPTTARTILADWRTKSGHWPSEY
jgi:hypothetical protein